MARKRETGAKVLFTLVTIGLAFLFLIPKDQDGQSADLRAKLLEVKEQGRDAVAITEIAGDSLRYICEAPYDPVVSELVFLAPDDAKPLLSTLTDEELGLSYPFSGFIFLYENQVAMTGFTYSQFCCASHSQRPCVAAKDAWLVRLGEGTSYKLVDRARPDD